MIIETKLGKKRCSISSSAGRPPCAAHPIRGGNGRRSHTGGFGHPPGSAIVLGAAAHLWLLVGAGARRRRGGAGVLAAARGCWPPPRPWSAPYDGAEEAPGVGRRAELLTGAAAMSSQRAGHPGLPAGRRHREM